MNKASEVKLCNMRETCSALIHLFSILKRVETERIMNKSLNMFIVLL